VQTPPHGSGEEGARHWWSPATPPPLPPISVRRAYTEVLGVFLAFFLVGVIGAALVLANRYHDLLNRGSWALYMTEVANLVVEIGLALTVVVLLAERRGVGPAALGLAWPPVRTAPWPSAPR